jgi:hypothetical protein
MERQEIQLGQRVKFRRSHDKTVELTGAIAKIDEDSDIVTILTYPDGRLVEVEGLETAHMRDVDLLEVDRPRDSSATGAESTDTAETVLEEAPQPIRSSSSRRR